MDRHVLPELGRHVESPDLVGHCRVINDPTVHVDLIPEQHARVSVSRQWLSTGDVGRLPDVAVVVVHVDHLGTMEALTANDVERVLPDDGTVACRALRRQVVVVHCVPVAVLGRLVAVRAWNS